jgi:uncharacterized protein (TIGR00645 family)
MTVKSGIESFIFGAKWLLVPFYIGLIVIMSVYCAKFSVQVYEGVIHCRTLTTQEIMLEALELVDAAMIANLIRMVITGSYQTFVCKVKDESLDTKVSSGAMKVKMGSSLITVGLIHLLPIFIDPTTILMHDLLVKMLILGIFIIATYVLSMLDINHEMAKAIEHEHEEKHKEEEPKHE